MKRFIFILAAALSLVLSASAQLEYRAVAFQQALPIGTTNSFIVDTRNTSGMALQVAFTGAGANTTTAIIGVTNSANATNGQSITVLLGSVTNVYTWTNSVLLNVTNLSLPATNLVIGITNAANATNGQTLNIVLNNRTNVFTFATPAMALTDIATNATAAGVATNLANSLNRTFTPRTVTVAGTIVTLSSLATDYQIGENDTGTFQTNNSVGFYTVTNIVATNAMQLQSTNAAGWAATNLFNRLSSDFAGVLTVTQPSASVVQLVTVLNPGLSVSQTGTWSTNQLTTNAIGGNIYFKGSNSLDKVTWFRAASRDFTVPFSGTSQATGYTNFTDLFAAGWWSWSVENAATNYANANAFQVLSAVKQGL